MLKKKITDGVELVDVEYLAYLVLLGRLSLPCDYKMNANLLWDLVDSHQEEFYFTQEGISHFSKEQSIKKEHFLVLKTNAYCTFISIEKGKVGTDMRPAWTFPKNNYVVAIKEGSLDFTPQGIEEMIVWKGGSLLVYYLELNPLITLMDIEFIAFQYKRGVSVFTSSYGNILSGPDNYGHTDIFGLADNTFEVEIIATDVDVSKLNPPVSVLAGDSEFGNIYSTVVANPEEAYTIGTIGGAAAAPCHIIKLNQTNYIVAFQAARIIKENLFFPMEDFVEGGNIR